MMRWRAIRSIVPLLTFFKRCQMPIKTFYISKDGKQTTEENAVEMTIIETDETGKVISESKLIREEELDL